MAGRNVLRTVPRPSPKWAIIFRASLFESSWARAVFGRCPVTCHSLAVCAAPGCRPGRICARALDASLRIQAPPLRYTVPRLLNPFRRVAAVFSMGSRGGAFPGRSRLWLLRQRLRDVVFNYTAWGTPGFPSTRM
jgi:hypothetical protein